MAGRLGSALTVLHVVDNAMPLKLAEQVKQNARDALKTYVESCKPLPDQKIDIVTAIGDPLIEIETEAISKNADLLVLGLHRERQFLDLLKETTMERLVRSSKLPVLLVADAADHDYRNLLCAVDMSRACAQAIRVGRHIAAEAEMALFHAYHVPYRGFVNPNDTAEATVPFRNEAQQQVDIWRQTYALPDDLPEPTFLDASPSAALEQMMAGQKPDVLVIGAHSRSNLGRYILGGFTAGLVRNPPCDLLVAK